MSGRFRSCLQRPRGESDLALIPTKNGFLKPRLGRRLKGHLAAFKRGGHRISASAGVLTLITRGHYIPSRNRNHGPRACGTCDLPEDKFVNSC